MHVCSYALIAGLAKSSRSTKGYSCNRHDPVDTGHHSMHSADSPWQARASTATTSSNISQARGQRGKYIIERLIGL